MNDMIIAGAVTLIGSLIAVMTPIIKLNTSITKLNCAIDELRSMMAKSDIRLNAHSDKIDKVEARVTVCETKLNNLEDKK